MSSNDNQPPLWDGDPSEETEAQQDASSEFQPQQRPDQQPLKPLSEKPWGVWATLVWMVLMIGATVIASVVAMFPYFVWEDFLGNSPDFAGIFAQAVKNGDFLWINYVVTVPILGAVLLLALYLRRGYPPVEYLALKNTRTRNWVIWPAALVVFSLGMDVAFTLVDVDPVADWMVDVYGSARCFPCLMLAVIIIAPLLEELVFRGFVFTGIETRLGPFWAVIFSAAPWAIIHMQYAWYHVLLIFALGLLLGAARWRTKSLLVPLAMHMLQNTIASIEMWLFT